MAEPSQPARRVLYVALDACDAGLMVELARGGVCPNVAELLDTGAVVDTVAPYGTFVGSSWMTISTGAAVGSHRYWNWLEVDPATYALRPTTPRESRRPPFWQHLSDVGRRVAVLDVPHADVPSSFNGVLLKEWGCHDRHHGTASHPPELLADLEQRVGRHPYGSMAHPAGSDAFAPCDYTLRTGPRRTRDEERQLIDLLRAGTDVKRELSLAVLDDGPWDLFVSVQGESHCVGHQLWHLHDESHPRHDPAARALLGDPVVEVYQRLDATLGEHLRRAGEDTVVWLQLNHGMGPHHDGDHLLDELLLRLDPLAVDAHRGGALTSLARRGLGRLPATALRALDAGASRVVRRRADAAPPRRSHPTGPRADRSWYAIPGNTTVGAVRCNLVGREAAGVLERGPALDELLERLEADLLSIYNLDTGRPAVRAVVRSEEVLDRSDDDGLPDLFVEWDRSAPIERVWSRATGTVAAPYDHWRTGDHNDRGLVVVRGDGIDAGRRRAPMSLVDVAPTICATLGAPLPHSDGAVQHHLVPSSQRRTGAGAGARRVPARLRTLEREAASRNRPSAADVATSTLGLAVDTAHRALAQERQSDADRAALDVERHRIDDLLRRVGSLERERTVWATTAWLANEPIVDSALVSVITPTHKRPERLREAIDSVVAQRYEQWELVVVDDGSDTAKAVVAEVGDDRITYLSIPHGGACAARNAGLAIARGSIITYLDDDNRLDPGWLQAVVWGFGTHPEHRVLYGARVIDDERRVRQGPPGGWPWLQFDPYDRAALERANFADMGVIAHRAGIAGARFDEAFWECGDWDFLLSITDDHAPLELPAVAFYYRTDGDDRLTGRFPDHEQAVRDKWAVRRAARGSEEI